MPQTSREVPCDLVREHGVENKKKGGVACMNNEGKGYEWVKKECRLNVTQKWGVKGKWRHIPASFCFMINLEDWISLTSTASCQTFQN